MITEEQIYKATKDGLTPPRDDKAQGSSGAQWGTEQDGTLAAHLLGAYEGSSGSQLERMTKAVETVRKTVGLNLNGNEPQPPAEPIKMVTTHDGYTEPRPAESSETPKDSFADDPRWKILTLQEELREAHKESNNQCHYHGE